MYNLKLSKQEYEAVVKALEGFDFDWIFTVGTGEYRHQVDEGEKLLNRIKTLKESVYRG